MPEEKISETKTFLAGSDKGLFKISSNNQSIPLWTDGGVEQIVRAEVPSEDGKFHEVWYFRTTEGILFSSDLETFELRNEGLPFLTIKEYDGQNTSFKKVVHTLKDIFGCSSSFATADSLSVPPRYDLRLERALKLSATRIMRAIFGFCIFTVML